MFTEEQLKKTKEALGYEPKTKEERREMEKLRSEMERAGLFRLANDTEE